MSSSNQDRKMRVSFDLDEVLFVSPATHKTEPPLPFPLRNIRRLFRCYGVRLDGIVNGTRHMKEVQRNSRQILPQKLPSRYRISLHIDDEEVICTAAGQYGFRAYQLSGQDDDWKEKIIEQADRIRKIEHFDEP